MDNLIQKIVLKIMKINDYWGELTVILAKKEALLLDTVLLLLPIYRLHLSPRKLLIYIIKKYIYWIGKCPKHM